MPANPITSSGAISMNALNQSFGRAGATQLSFSQSFGGVFAQYGAINRNTTAGQNIYIINSGNNFELIQFYSYNDVETNYWDYDFDMKDFDGSFDVILDVELTTASSIYGGIVDGGSRDISAGYVNTNLTGGAGGGDLNLRIRTNSSMPPYVDITVTDPDTSTALVSLLNEDPNNYNPAVTLCTIYGYQRFQMTLYFHG
jgi:hypothetical protein